MDTCRTPIPDRVTGMSPRSEGYGVDIVLIIVGRGPPVSSYNVIALDMRAPELTPIVFLIPWAASTCRVRVCAGQHW